MKQNKHKPIEAYNMAILDDDSAEINMYGDVVSQVPTDWEGNRLPGYIGQDEFLEDLQNIKDKSTITVHINSGGGDLYSGLAIYNRLKALPGNVITVNDGIAASAASLIFQAGKTRRMNAGSNLMAHGAAGFLFGFYNAEDLSGLVKEFKAHDRAIVNVYAEAMGVSQEEAKKLVSGETWLTGKEAVERGLADEVIEEEPLKSSFTNKLLFKLANMANPAAVPPIADISTEGDEDMEIKNLEDLKAAYPDYVAQIENAATDRARAQAIKSERARIKAIEEIEANIADKELVNAAKYGENPMTAEELALAAMQAQTKKNTEMLNSIEDDMKKSGAAAVKAVPEEDDPEKGEEEEKEAKNAFALYQKIKNGGKR